MKKGIWVETQERRKNGDPLVKGGKNRDIEIELKQFVKDGVLYESEVKNYKGR